MVDFSIFSRFNKDAKFDMIRFGGDIPVLETELNEMQQIIGDKINNIRSQLYTGFYGDGIITLNGNTFTISDQHLAVDDSDMYIDSLSGTVADGNMIYIDIFTKNISYTDDIHRYGNQQSEIIDNMIFDNRINRETTMRIQLCYDLHIGTAPGSADNHRYIEIARRSGNSLVDLRNQHGTVSDRLDAMESATSDIDSLKADVVQISNDIIRLKVDVLTLRGVNVNDMNNNMFFMSFETLEDIKLSTGIFDSINKKIYV